ncbi:hypothetical protein SAMN05444008_1051 [Cnuella takakiae]|uniref:Uncharacterized protein n=1 Tax=Cnuella takakiae TaxID=1302690 RepID=A0A1M4YW89_9BACT|nr:hypothetical protein SAMN05444008_1051 [Cnuella takakiae]
MTPLGNYQKYCWWIDEMATICFAPTPSYNSIGHLSYFNLLSMVLLLFGLIYVH